MKKQGKKRIHHVFFSLFFFVFSLCDPAPAFSDQEYIDDLVEAAIERGLHEDQYWHILLHYRLNLWGNVRSLVDDPNFFLSEVGKRSPKAELEATIRGFFQPPEEGKKHPVCRFAARFQWLKETLPMDPSRLPQARCDAFDRLMEKIKPVSVSLIFPTSHMNNPASMFGHTLLTIDTENESRLLSHAVNYAAVAQETFGPTFAVKGLFGVYEGYFSILPYYAKLQEYSDISHRDIWEYRLNLTPKEITRMMLHIYELEEIYSDYFFFDENCSFTLLFLIDAARPDLHLTNKTKWWVIPLDTVKLAKENHLVTEVAYRPSKTSKIKHLTQLTSETGQAIALSIGQETVSPDMILERRVDPVDQIRTTDLSIDYLQYRYAKEEISKDTYVSIFMPLLKIRSGLGNSDSDRPAVPSPEPPDMGHDPGRLRLSVGMREDEFFQEINLRPANHELVDDDTGYQKGAQIAFFDAAARYYPSDSDVTLEYVDVIDILSISPRDTFFKPLSWKIATGFTRKTMADGDESTVAYLEVGSGIGYDFEVPGLWYAMVITDLDVGSGLEKGYTVGAGAETGLLKTIGENLNCQLTIRDVQYFFGDSHNEFEAAIGVNYSFKRNLSFGIGLSRIIAHGFYRTEGSVNGNVYF